EPLSGLLGGQVPKIPPPAPPVPVDPAAPPEPAPVLPAEPAEPDVDEVEVLPVVAELPPLPPDPPVEESSQPQCTTPRAKGKKNIPKMGFLMGSPYFSSQKARSFSSMYRSSTRPWERPLLDTARSRCHQIEH